ncbi:hypothetical protein H2203_003228 [Taxawa tesnikishii (nom. ined.)]|nr:hypothetical protein H2203_003228 [Dothideales sp. JES 119]
MQDYENAVQFMNVVNPDAYGFVAKIFDPVVVVLAGSDRSGVPLEKRTWLSAVRRLAIEHFYPFALAVVFVVAFVTVLMNFLLWNANAEQAELENGSPEDPPLSADAVPTNHKLDIVRLAGSASGGLVSVALDRSVNCTAYHTGATAYKVRGINKEHAIHISWPVHAATMTRNGEFFALLCEGRRVVLYSCLDGHFLHDFTIETEENLPLIFEFTSDSIKGEDSPTLIIVTVDGLLIEHGVGPNSSSSHRISAPEINAAVLVKSKSSAIGVLALAADGTLCSGKKKAGLWQFSEPVSLQPSRKIDAPASLLALAELGTACICTTDRITFFQLASLSGGFDLECTNMKPSSVRVFHSRPKTCAGCTSAAVSSISIVYTDVQSQDCIMRTYAPSSEHAALLCLSSSKKDCAGLQTARMSEYKLSQPGAWEPTSAHAVVGVRRRVPSSPVLPSNPAAGQASLRNRKSRSPSQGFEDEGDEWEAYAFTSSGDIHTVVPSAVQNPDSSAEPQLFATRPGPACMLGPYTAAFTIGNVIYVVKVGGERTEKDSERASDGATTAAPSRRRLTARKA